MSAQAVPSGPGSAAGPRRSRRLRWLPRSWRDTRSLLGSWWYSLGGADLRLAYQDARRAPGWVLAGAVAVFWTVTGFSWLPIGVAVGSWVGVWVVSLWLPWWVRRRVRRRLRPLIPLVAFIWLAAQAGIYGWGMALGLWLLGAGLLDRWRARRRLLAWLRVGIAEAGRVDREEIGWSHAEWDGRRLSSVDIHHPAAMRTEEQGSRDRITNAVTWRLRHAGTYTVTWPPGIQGFTITAEPPLPAVVHDQVWVDNLSGIPVGVTDPDSAHGFYEVRDSDTGQTVAEFPLVLVDPSSREKHWLVVGGTGAGKTQFARGFIARALRLGWFPGGAIILDGKSSADYIPLEGRHGVIRVAREPEEWAEALGVAATMMKSRYDEDTAYQRGQRPKPDHPRYLLVLEEIQEIRATLGHDTVDPLLRQLARQMRGSNGRLLVITQRPDAEDAIPGVVKDMLEDRFVLGFVSATGARMVLDQDWRAVTDEYGAETVPGRGIARISGRLIRFQGFRLDSPRDNPASDILYPPRHTATGPYTAPKPAQTTAPATAGSTPPPEPLTAPDGRIDPNPSPSTPQANPPAGHEEPPPRSRRRTV